MLKYLLFLNVFFFTSAVRPGPAIQATKGGVWPQPQQISRTIEYWTIDPNDFYIEGPEDTGCPNFLNQTFERYLNLITTKTTLKETKRDNFGKVPEADWNWIGILGIFHVELTGECASEDIYPALGDNEGYTLEIDHYGANLSAETVWGILRGLETFSQLVYFDQGLFILNGTNVTDYPRFPHRGLLIDTSRHFEPLSIIYENLDAMAYNKLNVFHWHLTDDQSFPYKSRTFPELSEQGAYDPVITVYEQSDISAVIAYARLRGIRVIPEFDTPGHTRSWGVSHPELLTSCYEGDEANGELGPMDPTKDSTYDFVGQLFTEIVDVFPDEYFHIGGDEVDFDCWKSNPDLATYMEQNNISTYEGLENYFIQNIVNILDNLNSKYLVWEEVFDDGVQLSNSTLVHVWKNNGLSTLQKVVESGKYGIYSSCWYLSDLHSGSNWDVFYNCEPLLIIHPEEQRKLVLGGEACMWGEYVNEYSIIPRVWPRASAVAERLWSSEDVTDMDDAKSRLEEHSCRMNKRGIAAQPANGPGVCL